jgi:hypothetical protein
MPTLTSIGGREAAGPVVVGPPAPLGPGGRLDTAGGSMKPVVGSTVEFWARAGAETTTTAATSASEAAARQR